MDNSSWIAIAIDVSRATKAPCSPEARRGDAQVLALLLRLEQVPELLVHELQVAHAQRHLAMRIA